MEKLVEDHIGNALNENKISTASKTKKSLKRRYVSPPSTQPENDSSDATTATTATLIDPSLHQMKFIIEDFTDRKSQLSINAYDILDQHIHLVDEEIKLLETAIRLAGSDVPPIPSSSDTEDIQLCYHQKKKKKKSSASKGEPVYCLCQRANYGEMVRCDSDDCAIEWFHYPCVGLTRKPVKRWMCPECLSLHHNTCKNNNS